jgi:hypothetical protein
LQAPSLAEAEPAWRLVAGFPAPQVDVAAAVQVGLDALPACFPASADSLDGRAEPQAGLAESAPDGSVALLADAQALPLDDCFRAGCSVAPLEDGSALADCYSAAPPADARAPPGAD